MSAEKEKRTETVAEPIFDVSGRGILVQRAVPSDVAAALEGSATVLAPEVIANALGLVAASKLEHFNGLNGEMWYYNWTARALLLSLFSDTFHYTAVIAKLFVNGVWERNEEATYRVKLKNQTYFDLSALRVSLKVIPSDMAEIIGKAYLDFGNLADDAMSDSQDFKLKAGNKAGDVTLALTLEGYIGPLKKKLSYDGWYYDQTKSIWTYHPDYRQDFHIY